MISFRCFDKVEEKSVGTLIVNRIFYYFLSQDATLDQLHALSIYYSKIQLGSSPQVKTKEEEFTRQIILITNIGTGYSYICKIISISQVVYSFLFKSNRPIRIVRTPELLRQWYIYGDIP